MTNFETLLPDANTALRCSVFSRDLGIDPIGTAFHCDQVLVVELPLPWPKPVGQHPMLGDSMRAASDAPYPTKMLVAQPRSGGDGIRVTRWRRLSVGATKAVHLVADVDELATLVGLLATARNGSASLIAEEHPAPPAILVCTQGSHDVCCGTEGTRFADEIARELPGLDVYRVSHTGGHRFAPTAMTLPSGRMWAWLDRALLTSILEQSGDVREVAKSMRGWWGANRGPGQAAERVAFMEDGWDWESQPRMVHHVADDDIVVSSSSGDRRYQVTVSREVPIISCRADGGLPAKVGYEYSVEARAVRRRRA